MGAWAWRVFSLSGCARVEWGGLSAALPLARSTLYRVRVNSASQGPRLSKLVLRNLPPLNLDAQAAQRVSSASEATLLKGKKKGTSPDSSCWGLIWYLRSIYFWSPGRVSAPAAWSGPASPRSQGQLSCNLKLSIYPLTVLLPGQYREENVSLATVQ